MTGTASGLRTELAERFGTPLHLYDLDEVTAARTELLTALPERAVLYYALKANPHPDVARALRGDDGRCRAEISSSGELHTALEAGFDPAHCLYTGPGKTTAEIGHALDLGVRTFSTDSVSDVRRVGRAATERGLTAGCLLAAGRSSASKPNWLGRPVIRMPVVAPPAAVLTALTRDATEGGPVSYCLPYGRTPLAESVRNWTEGVRRFAALRELGTEPHLETFGGCLLGQLCPPSLLVAVSVLEALFFHRHGVRDVSVSYAQQTHPAQDREAVAALRRLCAELLPTPTWHVVIYAYMGLYPVTERGAYGLLADAAALAVHTGAERLIVKTVAESRRIPTIDENVAALEAAARSARTAARAAAPPTPRETATADSETYQEAAALVHAVLDLDPDPGAGLVKAFARGYLDVPWCLHPDNRGRTRSYIDGEGRLRWADTGSLPLGRTTTRTAPVRRIGSADLHADLLHVQRRYDTLGGHDPVLGETASPEITRASNRPSLGNN